MKIKPLNVKTLAEMHVHFRQQLCNCGGNYTCISQRIAGGKDFEKLDVTPPKKLRENEAYFVDIFIGKCLKCGDEREFYYEIIEKFDEPERKKSQSAECKEKGEQGFKDMFSGGKK